MKNSLLVNRVLIGVSDSKNYSCVKKNTYKEVSLCNSRASLSWNFVTTRYIYYINYIISQLPAKIGSQIVCTQTNKTLYISSMTINIKTAFIKIYSILLSATCTKEIKFKFNAPILLIHMAQFTPRTFV